MLSLIPFKLIFSSSDLSMPSEFFSRESHFKEIICP